VKAKKSLEETYKKAGETDKKVMDKLVEQYHESWEQLRDLESCRYQIPWGSCPPALFHYFREHLSLLVCKSRYEEG
jgi:hypothetical protein